MQLFAAEYTSEDYHTGKKCGGHAAEESTFQLAMDKLQTQRMRRVQRVQQLAEDLTRERQLHDLPVPAKKKSGAYDVEALMSYIPPNPAVPPTP